MATLYDKKERQAREDLLEDQRERPTHPDFMDASELRKIRFSGTRYQRITNEEEVWLEGECVAAVPMGDLDKRNAAYSRVFGLDISLVKGEGR